MEIKTKEQLIKENAQLAQKVQMLEAQDEARRKELSAVLENYEYPPQYGYTYNTSKTLVTGSWMKIAYLIGELKADADYSMVLEREKRLISELEGAYEKIRALTEGTELPKK